MWLSNLFFSSRSAGREFYLMSQSYMYYIKFKLSTFLLKGTTDVAVCYTVIVRAFLSLWILRVICRNYNQLHWHDGQFPQYRWKKPEITPNKSQYIRIRTTMVIIPAMYWSLTLWDSDASTLYILYHSYSFQLPCIKSHGYLFHKWENWQECEDFVQDYQTTSVRGKAQVKLLLLQWPRICLVSYTMTTGRIHHQAKSFGNTLLVVT